MKKQVKIIVSVLAILCALTVTVIAAYDSSEDPLISFSYLNDIFKKEILAEVDARFEELRSGIDDYLDNLELPEATVPSDPDDEDEPSGSASAAWDIVEITTGQ